MIPPGRIFIRQFLGLSWTAPSFQSVVNIDTEAHLDIEWSRSFAGNWNGQSFFYDVEWSKSPDLELFTDASDVGLGGFYQGQWFLGQWAAEVQHDLLSVLASENWLPQPTNAWCQLIRSTRRSDCCQQQSHERLRPLRWLVPKLKASPFSILLRRFGVEI